MKYYNYKTTTLKIKFNIIKNRIAKLKGKKKGNFYEIQ